MDEAAFEAHIADWLVDHGGYRRVKVGNLGAELSDFDPAAGVDTADLFEFIGATQHREWDRLVNAGYGGDMRQARAGFVKRLASQLDRRGTVDVLRRGVVDRNVKIQLAFFKPAHGLTPELVELYEANVLSVTRQLRYESSSNRTIDLGLFVNGVPVATAELKNPLTGQNVEHAIAQYRKRRDPKNRMLGRVGMVHFAVGSELGGDDHSSGRRSDSFPAVQSGPRSWGGESAQPQRAPYCLSLGAGVVS